jgi:histone-lysine N-methyltransferase SETMAR
MRKCWQSWVHHFLSPAQKVARAEASKQFCEFYKTRNQMALKELQQVMSPGYGSVIHLQQCLRGPIRGHSKDAANNWRQKPMIKIFFTARQLILLDVLLKGSKFNQQHFIDYRFPDFKTENQNFRRRTPLATFWVHMDNLMCHNGSKVVSKFDKHNIARLPHPPYSPDLSRCDFSLFGMLEGILKDREFHSHDESEEAITTARNDFTFDEVQVSFTIG